MASPALSAAARTLLRTTAAASSVGSIQPPPPLGEGRDGAAYSFPAPSLPSPNSFASPAKVAAAAKPIHQFQLTTVQSFLPSPSVGNGHRSPSNGLSPAVTGLLRLGAGRSTSYNAVPTAAAAIPKSSTDSSTAIEQTPIIPGPAFLSSSRANDDVTLPDHPQSPAALEFGNDETDAAPSIAAAAGSNGSGVLGNVENTPPKKRNGGRGSGSSSSSGVGGLFNVGGISTGKGLSGDVDDAAEDTPKKPSAKRQRRGDGGSGKKSSSSTDPAPGRARRESTATSTKVSMSKATGTKKKPNVVADVVPAVSSSSDVRRPARSRKRPVSLYDVAAADAADAAAAAAAKKSAAMSAATARASAARDSDSSSFVCCDKCNQWHTLPDHMPSHKFNNIPFDCSMKFWDKENAFCAPVRAKKAKKPSGRKVIMSNGVTFHVEDVVMRKGTAASTVAVHSVLRPYYRAAVAKGLSEDELVLSGKVREEIIAAAAVEMGVPKKQLSTELGSGYGCKFDGISTKARARVSSIKKLKGDGAGEVSTRQTQVTAGTKADGHLEQELGFVALVDDYDEFCAAIITIRNNMDEPLSQKNGYKKLVGISQRAAKANVKRMFEEAREELLDKTGCDAFSVDDISNKTVPQLMAQVDRVVNDRVKRKQVNPMDAEEEKKTRKASVLNAKAIFDKSQDALARGDAFCYKVGGKWRMFAMSPKLAERHKCPGQLQRWYGLPEDFVGLFGTDGSIATCIFTGMMLDTRARASSADNIKDPEVDLNDYVATPLNGTDDLIRQIHVTMLPKQLLQWDVRIRSDQNQKRATIALHQLILITADYHEIGVPHHAECRNFLGTNDKGEQQTIDDVFGYTVASERALERKYVRLRNPHRQKSKQCDGDHLAGREFIWLNGVLFVMFCSHGLNSCRSWVRKDAGDWCFMFGDLKYRGGSYVAK